MLPLYPGNENICRRMYLSGLINLTENFRFAYGQVLSYSVLSNELLRRNISSSQNTVLLLSSLLYDLIIECMDGVHGLELKYQFRIFLRIFLAGNLSIGLKLVHIQGVNIFVRYLWRIFRVYKFETFIY